MTTKITLEESINQSLTGKPDWWGYNDERRLHSEGFDASIKEINILTKNIHSVKENINTYKEDDIPPNMRSILSSYVDALKNLNEARKYFIAAGKAGNKHPNYLTAVKRGQEFYNKGINVIKEAKKFTTNEYVPTKDQIHSKLAELHNDIVRRMTANHQSESIRKEHMILIREHNTLAQIFKEGKNQTENLKTYSDRRIKESLIRFGYTKIKDLKIEPKGVSWIK